LSVVLLAYSLPKQPAQATPKPNLTSENFLLSQTIPDATLGKENSLVTPNANIKGLPTELISGGAQRGENLFHSFREFNVSEGQRVYFANPNGIENILSRVTGNNVSKILGTLGVNGSADLFLINPNGIIFGENASLDISGSFLATTAESAVFEDGTEFSAKDPQTSPLLSVKIPIGLQLGNNSASIQVNNARLEMQPNQNLALIGGNLEIDRSSISAPGGRVDFGGLSAAGTVNLRDDGSFSFPDRIARSDISLTNGAEVDVRAGGGGFIDVNARNLLLSGQSSLFAGIAEGMGMSNAQAGDITIDLTDNLTLDESRITNQVNQGEVGNSGNINVNTGSLTAINGGEFNASTSGQGNAGLVKIIAKGDLTFDGATSAGDRSGAISRVNEDGKGNAGGVTISTNNLTLTNGGKVDASTKGQGDAGLVEIIAKGDLTFDGATSAGDRSGVTSRVDSDGEGNAGGVTISTNNLTLTNGGRIDASTSGQGNAGSIEIVAKGDMTFDGTTSAGDRSGVTSRVNRDGKGKNGDITISTTNLNLIDGGRVDAGSTRGTGDGGSIEITATKDITLRNNSPISAQASEKFNGGNITIDARFIIAFPDSTNQGKNTAIDSLSRFGNDIIASAEQGQGGNININTKSLFGIEERPLSNSSNDINASSEFGLSGTVDINILEVDPSQDSLEIPVEPVQAEVAQTCELNSTGNQSEFVVTGRGGLPNTSREILNADIGWEDWRGADTKLLSNEVVDDIAGDGAYYSEEISESAPQQGAGEAWVRSLRPHKKHRGNGERITSERKIVEAQGWQVSSKGRILLTAKPTTTNINQSWQPPDRCQMSQPKN
jgi:filamentous hemagglutinin family protein